MLDVWILKTLLSLIPKTQSLRLPFPFLPSSLSSSTSSLFLFSPFSYLLFLFFFSPSPFLSPLFKSSSSSLGFPVCFRPPLSFLIYFFPLTSFVPPCLSPFSLSPFVFLLFLSKRLSRSSGSRGWGRAREGREGPPMVLSIPRESDEEHSANHAGSEVTLVI